MAGVRDTNCFYENGAEGRLSVKSLINVVGIAQFG